MASKVAPLLPSGVNRTIPSVDQSSAEFQSLLELLKAANVGGTKGTKDRIFVAEAFFSQVKEGIVPTLMTADRKIYSNLCLLSPACRSTARDRMLPVHVVFPNGFGVTVQDSAGAWRSLHVLPISPP